MRCVIRFVLRILFGFRAYNPEVLKEPGPVLLLPNHVSWIDWLFLWGVADLDWKCVVSSITARYSWIHRTIMVNRRTFPIDPASPYALRRMAEHLEADGKLVLFAEGQLSHTGSLMKLYDGTGFLLHRTRAKVITCYIRGAERLKWSRQPGWRRWFPRITVHFSSVLRPPSLEHVSTARARAQLTQWLRDRMVRQQFDTEMRFGVETIPEGILEATRRQRRKVVLQDATMKEVTFAKLLIGADLMAEKLGVGLERGVGRVGVLLPNVNAAPIVLLSLWALGKTPALLNFSIGMTTMLTCAKLAGLKHVVTARAFLERARIDPRRLTDAGIELLYLEDVRQRMSWMDKLRAWARMRLSPESLMRLAPGAESVAVVLFTSGSEGIPKGVELTHRNLMANLRQMLAVTDITDHDRVFNALPMFHSFGLSVGTLLGLVRGLYVFLYPSPLHYRVVPNVLYDRGCTVFLSTNTFLNGYARKAHAYDFRSLRYLFAGAEKVQSATARLWTERFGVRILEGYGITECSPAVSVNTPMAPRAGSTGRLMPGIEYRLEKVEGVEDAGRLLIRGPNVMRGYLNPAADAAFKAGGGWYDTGDIVTVDADRFVFIRGRMKRFAKISGEMVSLTAVEDALTGAFPQYGLRCEVAVVALPDEEKGEALTALTNEPRLEVPEIREVLRARGLPNLYVPRRVIHMREIPKLGTGKVNHRELLRLMDEGKGDPGRSGEPRGPAERA